MFTPTGEDNLVLRFEHDDGGFGKYDSTVVITECTNVGEGVRECWEGIAFGGGREKL